MNDSSTEKHHVSHRPKSPLIYAAFSLLGLTCVSFAPPSSAATERRAPPPTRAEVAEKRGDLKDIRGQIEELRKGVATAEDKRADTLEQLKSVEQEISVTQRGLLGLTVQRNKLQTTLKSLALQSRELESRLSSQQEQLERLAYRQYVQGNPDSLHLLLNGSNPNQTSRDLYYLGIIGRSRNQLLKEIEGSLQRKHALTADTRERADELAAIEEKQKEQHGKLLAQREQRKIVLDKIATRIADQRREIGNLKRDEKQLSQLVDRLAKAIAARPAPRRQPAKKEAVPEKESAVSSKPAPEGISNERTPEAVDGNFAQQKGTLRLPVRGVVGNRFGSARQEGNTWKGLFIRSEQGSEIRAIAGGRVVFADWMRGFGNLVIVDHGGSYLSIYGNSEAVLKQTGDTVRGGDTIATVGNSGGNPESGLYFELRYQGQPLDPLKWVNLK